MTALAMIIGMLPMSLGLGEGGEQNAPLGRAVIGGLIVATFTTLLIVPVFYSVFKGKRKYRMKKHKIKLLPILLLIVTLAILFLIGLVPKLRNKKMLHEEANVKINSTQPVILVRALRTKDTTTIELPGEVRALKKPRFSLALTGT